MNKKHGERTDVIRIAGGIIGFTIVGGLFIGIATAGRGYTPTNKESAMLIAGAVCMFIAGAFFECYHNLR